MEKILIIDDDQNRNQLFQLSIGEKYDLVFATNATTGFTAALKEKPDIIILDVILPGGLNGFDVLKKLKENVKTKNTPVIMQTNLEGQKKSAIDQGALEAINKTEISIEGIENKIADYLALKPQSSTSTEKRSL